MVTEMIPSVTTLHQSVTTFREGVTTLRSKARKRGLLSTRNVTTLLAVVTILAGCQTHSGSFCAISHPIRLSQTAIAALSDAEVATILAQNEKGQKLCGWHP